MASNKEEAAEATSDLKEPLTENNGKFENLRIFCYLEFYVKPNFVN